MTDNTNACATSSANDPFALRLRGCEVPGTTRPFTSSATQAAQLRKPCSSFSCAGLTSRDRTAIPLLAKLVHPEQRHHISSAQKAAKPADVACLLAALRSGAALNWNLGRGRRTPCAA